MWESWNLTCLSSSLPICSICVEITTDLSLCHLNSYNESLTLSHSRETTWSWYTWSHNALNRSHSLCPNKGGSVLSAGPGWSYAVYIPERWKVVVHMSFKSINPGDKIQYFVHQIKVVTASNSQLCQLRDLPILWQLLLITEHKESYSHFSRAASKGRGQSNCVWPLSHSVLSLGHWIKSEHYTSLCCPGK